MPNSSTPKVSVYTPSHDPKYLDEAYQSLKAQTFSDWEWVVYLNSQKPGGGMTIHWPGRMSTQKSDPRVKVYESGDDVVGVGEAKRSTVRFCKGEILVELDHDDILEPAALEKVVQAFEDHPDASLVYSQFAQMTSEGFPDPVKFDKRYGWEYEITPDGYLTPVSLPPTPHDVSLIWYAPNHLRAFTREAYDKTDGYDQHLTVLDDQDLMSKLYRVGEFVSIPECLYKQRLHSQNTQKDQELNARIQEWTWHVYDKNIAQNIVKWTSREGLLVASVDAVEELGEPGDFGAIFIKEAGPDIVHKILKAHEYLAPNGYLSIDVPEDRYINEHLFRAFIGSPDALFQESRIVTYDKQGSGIKVCAYLIALKPGYVREGGIVYNLAYA